MLSNEALTRMFATSDNTLSPDEVGNSHYLLLILNVVTDVVALLHQKVDTQF